MNEITLLSLFSGYGGDKFSLNKIGVSYRCIGFSDIEPKAIQIHEQNHKGKSLGDIRQINPNNLENFDLLTGGFPCQDVSIAGKGDLSKGRTTLFNEIIRIAEIKIPRFMLLENVRGLLAPKHKEFYNHTIREIRRLGYYIYIDYKTQKIPVLNSKYYGIPQNRERVFYICFKEKKDLLNFELPKKEKLKIFVKDLLEEKVDYKYYLNDNQIKKVMEGYYRQTDNTNICNTLTANDLFKRARDMPLIADYRYDEGLRIRKDCVSPTLCSSAKENSLSNQVIVHNLQPRSKDRPSLKKNPGSGGHGHLCRNDGLSYCLDTSCGQAIEKNKSWRRLTTKECFRLMGFVKDEINIDGLSDSALYKLAGNGWEINLISKIFEQMFLKKPNKQQQVLF